MKSKAAGIYHSDNLLYVHHIAHFTHVYSTLKSIKETTLFKTIIIVTALYICIHLFQCRKVHQFQNINKSQNIRLLLITVINIHACQVLNTSKHTLSTIKFEPIQFKSHSNCISTETPTKDDIISSKSPAFYRTVRS